MTLGSSWAHSACWWSMHGLASGSSDETAMESFPCSWWNQPLNEAPWNTLWTDYPSSIACVTSLDKTEITHYSQLEFPPLCSGLSSDFPRRPAGPVSAPSEDTDMT
ncbi:hypothetical protein B0H17DRAFT_1124584 [Mycena rosella]|uniref:Uncharacterized protein n=1 Tax=Mycena rosella TaxID=1033263 RepID=A0AAD7GZY8_MYCRO|nr:hypothetical protein B0H17DRAFT_1124584 [Mycena rosella]